MITTVGSTTRVPIITLFNEYIDEIVVANNLKAHFRLNNCLFDTLLFGDDEVVIANAEGNFPDVCAFAINRNRVY